MSLPPNCCSVLLNSGSKEATQEGKQAIEALWREKLLKGKVLSDTPCLLLLHSWQWHSRNNFSFSKQALRLNLHTVGCNSDLLGRIQWDVFLHKFHWSEKDRKQRGEHCGGRCCFDILLHAPSYLINLSITFGKTFIYPFLILAQSQLSAGDNRYDKHSSSVEFIKTHLKTQIIKADNGNS